MPTINLNLGSLSAYNELNISVTPGDTAYYIPANVDVGGFNVNVNTAQMVKIGLIQSILNTGTSTIIRCYIDDSTPNPSTGDFIFFGKDRSVNEASIVGYYGKFRFKNNSKSKAELFAIGCNVNISS